MSNLETFIKERKYLANVSPRTVEWYRESFKWLAGVPITKQGLKDLVIKMRERGLKATTCNCYCRAINAYLQWAETGLLIPRLKEPKEVLPKFTTDQISRLVRWKPTTPTHHRLHVLVCTMIDSGLRISEALTLTTESIDFDNLLLTVQHGKGDKQRIVPFSHELRGILWKYAQTLPARRGGLLFPTRYGTQLSRHVIARDFKLLCKELGFDPPRRTLHAIRHTFASSYIRQGGSQFHLMKILGHTSLEMTKKYVELQTQDLQAVHDRLTPLARR